ncbi:MAG TPA: helix-turn-helix transcriptional regulator [Caldilineae bacterium]|nr:helix-turn-helix transcriptional regulator [Caldilineae bacterium]
MGAYKNGRTWSRRRVRELRQQGLSQQEVAARVGVSRQAVSEWERSQDISNANFGIAYTPDLRKKIGDGEREEIYRRLLSGETQERVVRDHLRPYISQRLRYTLGLATILRDHRGWWSRLGFLRRSILPVLPDDTIGEGNCVI